MSSARAQHAADELNRFAERVGMPGRCDPELAFQNAELKETVLLWRELAADREMPLRSDLTARRLKRVLSNVAIVDVLGTDATWRFRMRLMGTSLSDLLGDYTGRFVDEAIVSPFRERWCAIFTAAIGAGEPLRVFGRLEYRQLDYIAIEMMVAPLGSSAREPDAVLVVAHTSFSARHVFEPLVRNRISGRAHAL